MILSQPSSGATTAVIDLSTPGPGQQAILLTALLLSASLVWWLTSRRQGVFRRLERTARGSQGAAFHLGADLAGRPLGRRGTFVLFSSATCATCPQVARVLEGVTSSAPGLGFIELPSERHMDLVRRLTVLRTPTVLLVDPAGAVISRTSGPVTAHQAHTALAALEQHAQPPRRSHGERR